MISKAPWGVPDFSETPRDLPQTPKSKMDIPDNPGRPQGPTRYAQAHQRIPRTLQRPPMTPTRRNVAPLAPSHQPPSLRCLGGIAKFIQYKCIYRYVTHTYIPYVSICFVQLVVRISILLFACMLLLWFEAACSFVY